MAGMSLDDLIERSIMLATDVGNKKRQHELNKMEAGHLNAMELQQLVESTALEKQGLANKGNFAVAQENTRGDVLSQQERNKGVIDEKLTMSPLDELYADYARMKIDLQRQYGGAFHQAALDSAQADAAVRKRKAAGNVVDPQALLEDKTSEGEDNGAPARYDSVEAADAWLAEDFKKRRNKSIKDYLDTESFFF